MRSSFSRRRFVRVLSSTAPSITKPRPQGRWISSQSPLLSPATPTRYALPTSSPTTSPPNSQRPNSSLSTIEHHPSNNDLHPITTAYGQPSTEGERVLLDPDNLFHSFSHSPSPEMRRRAAFIKKHAYCPHPSHYRTREPNAPDDPEGRKPISTATNAAKTPTRVVAAGLIDSHSLSRDPLRRLSTSELPTQAVPPAHVRFECPDCGVPVSCCQEHWEDDYESHLEICDTLRQINEDDHDLRSGRFFPEFDYPEPQRAEEFIINMSNWDTFLYTRDFTAIDDPRHMRQVTKLLTYPITIATVLHELSPYSIRSGGRLTNEGLRSLSGTKPCSHEITVEFNADLNSICSSPIYPPPTSLWRGPYYCRLTASASPYSPIHSRGPRRILSSPGSLGAIDTLLPALRLSCHLHRTRINDESRRGISFTTAHSRQSFRRGGRSSAHISNEDYHFRGIFPYHAHCKLLRALRSLLRCICIVSSWIRPSSKQS